MRLELKLLSTWGLEANRDKVGGTNLVFGLVDLSFMDLKCVIQIHHCVWPLNSWEFELSLKAFKIFITSKHLKSTNSNSGTQTCQIQINPTKHSLKEFCYLKFSFFSLCFCRIVSVWLINYTNYHHHIHCLRHYVYE